MKKLRLELEELSVESFPTAREPEVRGTVHGNSNYACQSLAGGSECYTDNCLSFMPCPSQDCSTRPICGPPPPDPEDPY